MSRRDRRGAVNVADLSARLADADIAVDPDGWALAAYRLAVARSELATDRSELETCIDILDKAARILTVDRAPLEHGRIMTAAGNCYRSAGRPDLAVPPLRRQPTRSAAGRNRWRRRQRGPTWAWPGPRQEIRPGRSMPSTGGSTCSSVRSPAAAGPTRPGGHSARRWSTGPRPGQAAATDEALASALADYDTAIATLGAESPQTGLAWHGRASVLLEQATRLPTGGHADLVTDAITAIEHALAVFSANAFPFQHAIARHSMAVAPSPPRIRRGSGPRRPQRRIGHRGVRSPSASGPMADRERHPVRSGGTAGPRSRIGAVVDLLVAVDEAERVQILRDRLTRLSGAPDVRVAADLERLCGALTTVDGDGYRSVVESLISVLMELPDRILGTGLSGPRRCQPRPRRSDCT